MPRTSNLKPLYMLSTLVLPLVAAKSVLAQTPDLLHVDKAVWTEAVDRDQKNYIHAYKSPVKLKQISLWMQLRGTPELLQIMKNDPEGKAHIRHVWKRYELSRLRTDLNQPLDIGRKEDIQKLSYEVSATGYFTWRIWSDKTNLPKGDWRVDLLWDTGEPIMCTIDGGKKSACSYPLQVR